VRNRDPTNKFPVEPLRPARLSAPLDLAHAAQMFVRPSVFRALGYTSLEHEFYPSVGRVEIGRSATSRCTSARQRRAGGGY
jgi:hypothetical protein